MSSFGIFVDGVNLYQKRFEEELKRMERDMKKQVGIYILISRSGKSCVKAHKKVKIYVEKLNCQGNLR